MNFSGLLTNNQKLKRQLALLRPRLYRIAYSWTHDQSLADDLTQESLIKALKKCHQLRDTEKLHSWTFGILHNCYHDHFRRHKNLDNIDDHTFIDDHQPETDYEHYSITLAVQDAIKQLPDNQRQILTLVDLEGSSYAEVAQILDVPTGTVMSRLCRARKALAEKLLSYSDKADNLGLRRIK